MEADSEEKSLKEFKKKLLEEGYSSIDDGNIEHRYIAYYINEERIDDYFLFCRETYEPYSYKEGEDYNHDVSKQKEYLGDDNWLGKVVKNVLDGDNSLFESEDYEYTVGIRTHVKNSFNRFVEKNYEKYIEQLDLSTCEVKKFDPQIGILRVERTGHWE